MRISISLRYIKYYELRRQETSYSMKSSQDWNIETVVLLTPNSLDVEKEITLLCLISRYGGSKFKSEIQKLEEELERQKIETKESVDKKAYEKRLLDEELDSLNQELLDFEKETKNLLDDMADLKLNNNFLEYKRVS